MAFAEFLPLIASGLGMYSQNKQRQEQRAANATNIEARREGAAMADPFAPYRSKFADRLLQLYGINPEVAAGEAAGPEISATQNKINELQNELQSAQGAHYNPKRKLYYINGKWLKPNQFRNPSQIQAELNQAQSELMQQQESWKMGQEAKQAATPMPSAAETLSQLPGFQFALDTGIKAATRGAAAQGRRLSGNLLQELTALGTGLAEQTFGEEFNRLGAISGATSSGPQVAGQILGGTTAAAPTTSTLSGSGAFLGELYKLFQGENSSALPSGIGTSAGLDLGGGFSL